MHFGKRNFINRLTTSMLCIIMFLSATILTACSTTLTDPVTVSGFALNTYVSISAYTTGGHSTSALKDILNEALNLCNTYEAKFSRTLTSSTLYKVNNHTQSNIDAELGELIQTGLDYSATSNGAFDITIGSVSSLWDFTSDNPVLPEHSELLTALQYVDYRQVSLEKCEDGTYNISLPDGMIIDLGAVAKGYIADRIKDFLIENNITSAIINLGGNVLCIGKKNASDKFNVALKDPSEPTNIIKVLQLDNMSCVTSGSYERSFEHEGKLYHHILNPKTAYPYDNGLTSVTIISNRSVTGDCLSTVCYSLGKDEGLKLINSIDGVEAMFITDNNEIYYSDNFESYISKSN